MIILKGVYFNQAIESRLRPSCSLGADMALPYIVNRLQLAVERGISRVESSSDAVRTVNSNWMYINRGFKDPAS
ncbi:hypothetical protein Hanom_Chr08g00721821 [Helianthus anomalus]